MTDATKLTDATILSRLYGDALIKELADDYSGIYRTIVREVLEIYRARVKGETK